MADNYSLLAEHQAPENGGSNGPAGYMPSDEEQKTIKMVNSLFEKAKKYRKTYDKDWLENYKFFRGKQWKEQRPTYRHSEVINMVFQTIQSTVPVQLDTRPRFEFMPQNPSDSEFAHILNQISDADWTRQNWLMEIAEMLYDGNIYGTALAGVEFDPDAEFGIGAIEFKSADPFYSFPDPNARKVNEKRSKFYIYAEPEDVEVLKAKYPDKAQWIKPDLQDLLQGNKNDIDQVRFKSPTDTRVAIEGSTTQEEGATPKALKITAWIKSDEYIEEEKDGPVDESTGLASKIFEQKKKYPNGRKIVLAGGVLCEDGPNPYDDGLFPYIRYLNYILPREFWGMSELEQLKGPQKIFNKLLSFALDIYTLMGNPIWVVDTTSGIDTDNLFNRPGLVVEKEPGSEARREAGVEVSPTLLALVDRLRNWFNETAGQTDVSQGIQPGEVTAASAITALQEAAQNRLRQKSRNLDATLQDFGQLYLSRVFQFYSSPRIARVTENENSQKFFRFHIETQTDEQGQPVLDASGSPVRKAMVTPFNQDPVSGQHVEGDPKEYLINGMFDVKISTGSSLPFAKTQKTNLALKLFQLQAIDRPELLKAVEYPNWQEVAARMDEKEQQAKQEAMQAQAAKAGGAPQ